ncbi:MAG: hypothetical protein MHM6MM_006135 [Cercozoa sp. M6MM]
MRLLTACVLVAITGVRAIGTNCGALEAASDSVRDDVRALPREKTPENFKVAFFGDSGIKETAYSVMRLIKKEGAEAVVHAGDLDYESSPSEFFRMIDSTLGEDFPFFIAVGNHDLNAWKKDKDTDKKGYRDLIRERYERQDIAKHCTGKTAENEACLYKGLLFALSGVGTRGKDWSSFLDEALSAHTRSEVPWKVCNWHKNQRKMQVGGKSNEVGWSAYETCRKHGALVATGHEHSYARTHMMSSFKNQVVSQDTERMTLRNGESVCWCAGTGGKNIRPCKSNREQNPWWASYGCEQVEEFKQGALFCTFNYGGLQTRALCEYKDYTGRQWDQFLLHSELSDVAAAESSVCVPEFVEVQMQTQHERTDDGAELVFAVPDFEPAKLTEAHVQLYGKKNGDSSRMQLWLQRGDITIAWTEDPLDEEAFEAGETWVSPDISPIIRHGVEKGELRIRVSADVPLYDMIVGYDEDECLAPALTLEFVDEC